jgi:hypothetical protein
VSATAEGAGVGTTTLGGTGVAGEVGEVVEKTRLTAIGKEEFVICDMAVGGLAISEGVGKISGNVLENGVFLGAGETKTRA